MTRDIIEINNFLVLIEQSASERLIIEKCGFDEPVIGFAFYGSGNVQLDIHYGSQTSSFNNTKGMAMSFFANQEVVFEHGISYQKPLQCICILVAIKNLPQLPEHEAEAFAQYLYELVNPQDSFVAGPTLYMQPAMQQAVDKIFNTPYEGAARLMFLRSQVIELVSHFIASTATLETQTEAQIKPQDQEKLHQAKEILINRLEAPPSLTELSKMIGLNSYKLKKNFKELFGVPVFKYLQNERLDKAHHLLSAGNVTIQEAAWQVGYESLSSFSTAFLKKFGFRPSEIKA